MPAFSGQAPSEQTRIWDADTWEGRTLEDLAADISGGCEHLCYDRTGDDDGRCGEPAVVQAIYRDGIFLACADHGEVGCGPRGYVRGTVDAKAKLREHFLGAVYTAHVCDHCGIDRRSDSCGPDADNAGRNICDTCAACCSGRVDGNCSLEHEGVPA